jgi:phage baseplate assembly protein W
MPKGLRIPFNVEGGGIASTSSISKLNDQKITNVLVTSKLERHMLPDYGAGVQALLFDAIDELVEVDFKTDAVSEILSRVSGITVLDIKVVPSAESEATITVYYRTPLSSIQSTSFSVVIPGSLNEESPL